MNINKTLTFTILCIIMPHTYTMELVSLKSKKKTDYTPVFNTDDFTQLSIKCGDFTQLPIECIDTIIFYNQPQAIGALKSTCKQFAEWASILKASHDYIHNFIIQDNITRSTIFKRIIMTDNPAYIGKIIDYYKNKTILPSKQYSDAVVIDIEGLETDNDTSEQVHLYELFKEAIQQNNSNVTKTILKKFNEVPLYHKGTWLHYAAKHDSDSAIEALLDDGRLDIDAINQDNQTALYIAWDANKTKAIVALNINEQSNNQIKQFRKIKYSPYVTGSVGPLALCIVLTAPLGLILGAIISASIDHHSNNITL